MKGLLGAVLLCISIAQAQQPLYGQCGGVGWTGSTTCVSGGVCTKLNDCEFRVSLSQLVLNAVQSVYSQCLPGQATSSNPASSTTPVPTPTTSVPTGTTTSAAPPYTPTATGAFGHLANMSPEWRTAYEKARTAVSKLSLNDKVNLATGVQWRKGPCVGNTPAISSIGFPGLCLQDGPLGIRFADKVTAFPAGINAAATFNRTLMRLRGSDMGAEFRGKGINVALAPAMNVQRVPAGGRNWEAFGSDPYLNGEAAYETIMGIQSQGVQTSAKHFINNEQEHFRESSSSNVDDRTTPADQLNSTWACENDKMLNQILKGEMGFPGYWWATHSTTSVNSGLDMTMPGTTYFGQNLVNAVNQGRVNSSRIDDIALRILAGWYLLKQDSGFPSVNFNSWNINGAGQHIDVQGNHKQTARAVGAASTVLLKNVGGALPLKSPRTLAIIGNGAGPGSRGPNGYEDRAGNDGVLGMGWGSGTVEYPYLITPLDAIKSRAGSGTTTSTLPATAANGKDYALVFITADGGEGYLTVEGHAGDRNDLKAWHNGDALVQRVAQSNTKTIVVVNTVGPIEMEPWINNTNVVAVVWSGLPGQEAGNAVADVLFGDYNPSGRLPYTIGKAVRDYSAQVLYNSNTQVPTITYSEGLNIDYRHFDKNNIEPRFEFGFGLSYTTFAYGNLRVSGSAGQVTVPSGPGTSLDPKLHEKVVTVTFDLTNNGTVAGHEIPQLYIGLPASADSPPKSLKGFDSVYLAAGQTKSVTMELSRFDLSIWDTAGQRWRVPAGTTDVLVGASSRDIRLRGSVTN
ncbi:cellulose-binding beta-glucosidase [Coprinellus micaceus]|uniref:beta-glucosidase n=1 Tax=Coprinellus micaceus TaxID=71717 RepID=A0A4Y7TYC1_COPMI|nr:cellulose-binding beta-glucosidase [Coprinellus micaceus]